MGAVRELLVFPGGLDDKESACKARNLDLMPGGKIPWRRDWLPTPVFLCGEFHEGAWPADHGVTKSWT